MSSKAKAKTQARYCHFLQWIERRNPGLAAAITSQCFQHAFNGIPSGRTFIYPGDQAAAAIVEAAQGDEPEAALDMLKACLVPRFCATPAEAEAAGGLHGFKFAGAKFKKTDFVPRSDLADKLAVFESAGVPEKSAEEYRPAPVMRAPRGVRGGGPETPSLRFKMAAEAAYRFLTAGVAGSPASYAVYARRVLSLKAACASHGADAAFDAGLDWDPLVAFYLLVEPHKETGTYLLSDEVIEAAAKTPCPHGDVKAAYKALFKAAAGAPGEAFRAQLDTAPRVMIGQIVANYPLDALWRDEFRSWVGQTKPDTVAGWVKFFNHQIPECWSGNDCEGELTFCSQAKLAATVAARDMLMATLRFVYSTDFHYQPAAELATAPYTGAARLDAELTIWNRSKAAAVVVDNFPDEQLPTIPGMTPAMASAILAAYGSSTPEAVWRSIAAASKGAGPAQ